MNPAGKTLLFKQSHFVTHLPVAYRFTRSHFWAETRAAGRLRLGFTRFATRMLGELVDYHFDTPLQAAVRPGQVLGWIEGFKALSDLICVAEGTFAGGNPALEDNLSLVSEAAYTDGWLYEVDGQLDEASLDVQEYAEHLKATIDRFLSQQNPESQNP